MTALLKTGTSLVHASYGRWCAFCSNPYCDEAVEFNSIKPPILPVFAPGFQCWACFHNTELIWPPPRMVAGIERLLSMRPNPKTRNWFPGETLTELHYENGLHGIYNHLNKLELDPDISPMVVADHEILEDILPASLTWRQMLAVES